MWENIQGPVRFDGAGFVARDRGNYQIGEFKRLSNLEFNGSELRNRRNINTAGSSSVGSEVEGLDNSFKLIGNLGNYTLAVSSDKQFMFNYEEYNDIWFDPDQGPSEPGSFSRIVGCFRYNNINYWIVLEFDADPVDERIGLSLYWAPVPADDLPENYGSTYKSTLTRTQIISFEGGLKDFFEFNFLNHIIHKDRLWIATPTAVFFSKATDPTVFLPPEGGFFKYPENTIKWIMGVRDYIYVLNKESVYAITYDTDPNLDSSNVVVSPNIGGEHGCIHQDTAYFINNLGIFRLRNLYLEKVLDSRFDVGTDVYQNFLYSFENYLVVNKANLTNYEGYQIKAATGGNRVNLFTHGVSSDDGVGEQIMEGTSVSRLGDHFGIQENDHVHSSWEVELNNPWNVISPSGVVSTRSNRGVFDPPVPYGDYYNLITDQGQASGSSSQVVAVESPFFNYGVEPGKRLLVGGSFVKPVVREDNKLNSHPTDPRLIIRWFNDNTFISADVISNDNTWGEKFKIVTVPAGANRAKFRFRTEYTRKQARNPIAYLDGFFRYSESKAVDSLWTTYLDGSFVLPGVSFNWGGLPFLSSSFMSVPVPSISNLPVIDSSFSGKVAEFSFGGKWLNSLSSPGIQFKKVQPISDFKVGSQYTLQFLLKNVLAGDPDIFDSVVVKVEFKSNTSLLGSNLIQLDVTNEDFSDWVPVQLQFLIPPNTEDIELIINVKLKPVFELPDVKFRVSNFILEKSNTFRGYFNGSFEDTDNRDYEWEGTPWESKSLVVSEDSHSYLKSLGYVFTPFRSGNHLGYNTYFINTDNGSTHVLDFCDQCNFDHGPAGYITSILVNSHTDGNGNYYLYFLTNKLMSENQGSKEYRSYVYRMSSSEDVSVCDHVVNDIGITERRAPKIDLEVDSFCPDGLEYMIKKFRSFEINGIFPSVGIDLDFAFDNGQYINVRNIKDDPPSTGRPHYPRRIGVNQRARSFSFRILNKDWFLPLDDEVNFGFMEISDMRTLWSYTARGPVSDRIDKSFQG